MLLLSFIAFKFTCSSFSVCLMARYNLFRDRPFGTNIIPVTGLGAHSDSTEKITIAMLIVASFIGIVGM
jgi:hypothetical protein